MIAANGVKQELALVKWYEEVETLAINCSL